MPDIPLRSGRISSSSGGDARDPEELFRQKYALFQYHYVEFITEHLIDVSRQFGGDLQEVLVLAMIGQMALRARMAPEAEGRSTAISASRIADVTCIPRQTVRRKLQSLRARGWIEQDADHGWRLIMQGPVSTAQHDLQALDERGIKRAVRLHAAFSAILDGKPGGR